jgi:hypothetical protein
MEEGFQDVSHGKLFYVCERQNAKTGDVVV